MSEKIPAGEERKVEFLGGAAIDGAPVAYIVVLAAVVVALSFFPFSVVLASGGSFPMSQGIFGLVGWILGPIAGAVATGIGVLIGGFLAPHTAGVLVVSILGGMTASFAAGCMVFGEKRKGWWVWVFLYGLISYLYFIGRALFLNGIGLWPVIAGSFLDWSGLLLFALPTRTLFGKWINGKNWGLVIAGLALGTWTVFGLAHATSSAITYHMFNWPEEVWTMLIPIIPFENLIRVLIGVVIGGGVIAGLRAIGLVKPENRLLKFSPFCVDGENLHPHTLAPKREVIHVRTNCHPKGCFIQISALNRFCVGQYQFGSP